jgi:protein-disulfide isomerase
MSDGVLKVPLGPRDHIQGSPDAPVVLLEYGDYQCPYCGRAYPIVKALQRRLGNVMAFAFRNFPLTEIHPQAEMAAEAAEAAGARGKFWPMHDMIYEHQQDGPDALEVEALATYASMIGLNPVALIQDIADHTYLPRIRDDFMSGVRSGVNGTPTFFINGVRFDGDWTDVDALVEAISGAAVPA